MPLRTLHLFAGAGGGLLCDLLLEHQPVCAVEIDPYCCQVLNARQKDGILPWFPIFGDVKTFDGKPWRGLVDVVAGGFPCTDISTAGKGAGINGEQSGLWAEMARIICEVRPTYIFVENSPALVIRGLGRLLGDLAKMGFNARWGVLGANHAGSDLHRRRRIWILADSNKIRLLGRGVEEKNSETPIWRNPQVFPSRKICELDAENKYAQPYLCGKNDGVANRVDRLASSGNGQIPIVAALAWETLNKL